MSLLGKPNRRQARQARQGSGYCASCDRAIVRPGQKCPVCGARPASRRDKKPAPQVDHGDLRQDFIEAG